jgi:hypothetical protein
MYKFWVTRRVGEKNPKCSPTQLLSKLMHNIYLGKELPKNLDSLFFKKKPFLSKLSPNGPKLAQSGHSE